MSLLDRLEKRYRRYAVHNLTAYLLMGQVLSVVAAIAQPAIVEKMMLIPSRVLAGEVWRLITFVVVMPAPTGVLEMVFLVFYFWLLWFMGTALENQWGAFRYNVYVFLGLALTLAASWLTPDVATTSQYVYMSIFLGFAYLFPDFEILLFFFFPVKIKWLALLTWLFYGYTLLAGDWTTRCMVLAGAANFLVFFGPELLLRARSAERRRAATAESSRKAAEPFHVCSVCGVTDKQDPQRQFRYDNRDGQTVCVCETCLEREAKTQA